MCLPLPTVFVSEIRGTVFGEVSHLDCQSESGVTTSQPPKPATALLASVLGGNLPFAFRQKRLSAGATTARTMKRIAVMKDFIRPNENKMSRRERGRASLRIDGLNS